MSNALINEFQSIVKQIVGQPCWSVQYSGVGSLISLHFGGQVEREEQLLNPDFDLRMEERFYQGTYVLYVEDCPWRIESESAVIASWLLEGDDIKEQIQVFLNKTPIKAELTLPALDLAIQFDDGYTLRIFPDQIEQGENDNYSLTVVDKTYVIGIKSNLSTE